LLCLIRDMDLPLPAGAMLISPWVDLTHSFPSITDDGDGDYIPNWGFHHRPSLAWPPPTVEDLESLRAKWPGSQLRAPSVDTLGESTDEVMGYKVVNETGEESHRRAQATETPRVEVDGKVIEVKDQIQMVAPNEVLDHPLLSPVTQASLGGLCPLLIVYPSHDMLT
jgi:acetyl esterase/lipase